MKSPLPLSLQTYAKLFVFFLFCSSWRLGKTTMRECRPDDRQREETHHDLKVDRQKGIMRWFETQKVNAATAYFRWPSSSLPSAAIQTKFYSNKQTNSITKLEVMEKVNWNKWRHNFISVYNNQINIVLKGKHNNNKRRLCIQKAHYYPDLNLENDQEMFRVIGRL